MNFPQSKRALIALPYIVAVPFLLGGCASASGSAQASRPPETTGQTVATAPQIPTPEPSAVASSAVSSLAPEPSTSAEPTESGPAEAQDSPGAPTPQATSAPSLTPPVNDGFRLDPASIVTTDIVAPAVLADPAAYRFEAADQPSVVFQTPDSSVACLMQSYGVFCMTDDSKNWVLQSVSMAPGDTLPRTLQARGRAATHDWFQTHMVLPEGQTLQWMGMNCTSTSPQSVQCSDGTTGFNLSNLEDR